ncbi:LysR family transcriptional regulator [Leucobacter ruminantium]|uniref:LysR family transcriptional regulator n=1 Tax=Leucobacter ruminantium TaxID=1289170 RepID=A0A939RTJ3_9MICO|nr:LysR family transcriptional regulator [Leucobacter ruminantium]MBO1804395.1 LysR family transcriptional regulator [Leucobacter ruminantium]
MLNLNRLALLQELHRRGTVVAVADALSFTPSTVSQQLKVLEREVGAPLVERVGRGLQLTREGELLAKRATRIFAEVEGAEAQVAAVGQQARGDVKVAALQTASLALIPRTLVALDQVDPHPRMVVSRIEPHRALNALEAREYDIVLGEEYPGLPVSRRDDVHFAPLVRDPLELVVPLDYEGEGDLRAAAECLPWVMELQGSDARRWSVGLCREQGFEPEVQFESDDLLVQMRLVETGHAIGILPKLLLDSEKPKLRRIRLAEDPARLVFVASRAGASNAPAIRAVLNALADAAHAPGDATESNI